MVKHREELLQELHRVEIAMSDLLKKHSILNEQRLKIIGALEFIKRMEEEDGD